MRNQMTKALLEARVQLPNGNVAINTEKMTSLFCHTDPNMSEEKKGRFLIQGVNQELYARLIRNPVLYSCGILKGREDAIKMASGRFNANFTKVRRPSTWLRRAPINPQGCRARRTL